VRVRINVSLPEETVRLMDRVAPKGDRSYLVNEAVTRYIAQVGRERLRRRLQEGATARADRDRAIAAEWAGLEDETWRRER